MTSMTFERTAIPFDSTDAAATAVERLAGLLENCEVIFVMVLDQYVENALSDYAETEGLTIAQAALSACEALVATATGDGINASHVIVTEKDVIDGLLHTATERNCTAIVLPTHHMSGVTRWLTGNMRDKIVHATNLPVLVLPGT